MFVGRCTTFFYVATNPLENAFEVGVENAFILFIKL
jgi:hypothetical protein